MKRRILRKLKITEISGVDRPCQEEARVTIMKRHEPEDRFVTDDPSDFEFLRTLARANAVLEKTFEESKHPRADDGKWTSAAGGASRTGASAGGIAAEVVFDTIEEADHHNKATTLRWARNALWVAKVASWGITIAVATAAFTAALPVGGTTFAIGAALSTLISKASLTRIAAFFAFDQMLSALIDHRERELNKADGDDPILATLKAMRAELQKMKPEGGEENKMSNDDSDLQKQLDERVGELRKEGLSGCDALRKVRTEAPPETFAAFQHGPPAQSDNGAFEQLVAEEIRKGAPASVAGQRVINRYGPRPDAARIAKSEGAVCEFMAAVDRTMIEKRCSRTAAMTEVRRANPAAFAKFQEV